MTERQVNKGAAWRSSCICVLHESFLILTYSGKIHRHAHPELVSILKKEEMLCCWCVRRSLQAAWKWSFNIPLHQSHASWMRMGRMTPGAGRGCNIDLSFLLLFLSVFVPHSSILSPYLWFILGKVSSSSTPDPPADDFIGHSSFTLLLHCPHVIISLCKKVWPFTAS